jgi:hypothetical protein
MCSDGIDKHKSKSSQNKHEGDYIEDYDTYLTPTQQQPPPNTKTKPLVRQDRCFQEHLEFEVTDKIC